MKPTMAILERISKNSQENIDEVFTRLYRYLLRPDIYYVAYQNLYSNKGASTKGILDDTADGFSEEKIKKDYSIFKRRNLLSSTCTKNVYCKKEF